MHLRSFSFSPSATYYIHRLGDDYIHTYFKAAEGCAEAREKNLFSRQGGCRDSQSNGQIGDRAIAPCSRPLISRRDGSSEIS